MSLIDRLKDAEVLTPDGLLEILKDEQERRGCDDGFFFVTLVPMVEGIVRSLEHQRNEMAKQYLWMLRHANGFHYDNYDEDLGRSFKFLDIARSYVKED